MITQSDQNVLIQLNEETNIVVKIGSYEMLRHPNLWAIRNFFKLTLADQKCYMSANFWQSILNENLSKEF